MSFADALREFVSNEERAQPFNPDAWPDDLPYQSEFEAFTGGQIRRGDVFAAAEQSDERGAIFALVWGFPKGHTSHFNQAIRKPKATLKSAIKDHREQLGRLIHSIREYGPRRGTPVDDLNVIPGLKTAATSKIAYFARLTHNNKPCLILDQQVVRAIVTEDFPELARARQRMIDRADPAPMGDDKATGIVEKKGNYEAYLEEVNRLANDMNWEFEEDDIERFLFELGSDVGRRYPLWTELSRRIA